MDERGEFVGHLCEMPSQHLDGFMVASHRDALQEHGISQRCPTKARHLAEMPYMIAPGLLYNAGLRFDAT